jgi:hypothetical protein
VELAGTVFKEVGERLGDTRRFLSMRKFFSLFTGGIDTEDMGPLRFAPSPKWNDDEEEDASDLVCSINGDDDPCGGTTTAAVVEGRDGDG